MLKSLLSLLLSKFYGKRESELVGHQAMPSATAVEVQASPTSVTAWTQVASYTAPTDGYISVRGLSQAEGSVIQLIAGQNTQNPSISTTATSGGQWPQTVMPVAKGRNIAVYCGQTSNITVFFNKAIGGGYQALKNALLQGGGLCLKVWFSSLRRNSCRVREKKLGVGLIQKAGIATLFTSMVSLPQHRFNIPHLRMELCNLLLEQICKISSKSRDLYTILRPVLTRNTQKNGLLHIIELQRDAPSNLLYSHSKQQTLTTSSLSHSTNFALGGASC